MSSEDRRPQDYLTTAMHADILDLRSPNKEKFRAAAIRLGRYILNLPDNEDPLERIRTSNKLETGFADPLTGLPNKEAIKTKVNEELKNGELGRRSAIAMFDIVDFGEFNNEYGQNFGDGILKGFAQSLSDSVRVNVDISEKDNLRSTDSTDIVASMSDRAPGSTLSRYGGDEFAVIFKDLETGKKSDDLRDFAIDKAVSLLIGMKSLMAAMDINEFGVHANIVWIDPLKYSSYGTVIDAVDMKSKVAEPHNKFKLIMQIENGRHSFYEHIRGEHLDR